MIIKVWHTQGNSAVQSLHEDVEEYIDNGKSLTVIKPGCKIIYSLQFMQRAEVYDDGEL